MTATKTPSSAPATPETAAGKLSAEAPDATPTPGTRDVVDSKASAPVTRPGRRVWRCARSTLVVVTVLMVVVGLAIPAAAVVSLVTGVTAFGDRQVPVLAIIGVLAVLVLFFGWRLALHPRLAQDGDELTVINPFHKHRLHFADITIIRPGGDGLQIATPDEKVEAWCVQKPTRALKNGDTTRADRVCDQIREPWQEFHLPDQDPANPVQLRFARAGDADLLTDLERSASMARLTHIFPPDEFPYPDGEVRQRWREVLSDQTRLTVIAEVDGIPAGFASYGQEVIQHVGVSEDFQRQGVGTTLVEAAEDELFSDLSTPEIGLWVLEANEVARAFYARMGWTETGESRKAEFPPYPPEVRMFRPNPHLARRGR